MVVGDIYSHLTMLEGLLLLKGAIIRMALRESGGIERHVAGDAAAADRETGLGVEDGVTTLGSLDELRILLLENLEVLLSLPVPDAVGREKQIHLFEGALVGLGIQGPDHRNRDRVRCGKDVVRLFVESLEHDGAKEGEPTVPHRPTNHSPSIPFRANFKGKDFSRIQPWNGEPGSAEGGREEEDHSDCA